MGIKASVASQIEKPRIRCHVALLYERLSPEEAAEFREVLNGDYTSTAIQAGLAAEGYKLGDSPIRRHRAGKCNCGTV